jgi:hypothetical protein
MRRFRQFLSLRWLLYQTFARCTARRSSSTVAYKRSRERSLTQMADGIALLGGAFRMPRPLLVSNFCLSMYCQSFTMMYWSECCRGATVECKTRAMPQLEIRRATYDGTGQTRIGVDDLRARILRDHERIELPLSGLGVHGFYLRLNVDVIFESSIVVLLCVQNEGDQPLIASPIASRMMSTTRSGAVTIGAWSTGCALGRASAPP